jgi:hypothetical protein
VAAILGEGLHLDCDKHVDKTARIGQLADGKSRPIRIIIKTLDAKRDFDKS